MIFIHARFEQVGGRIDPLMFSGLRGVGQYEGAVAYGLLSNYRSGSMILSSDELEILEYLKSWNGNFVSMVEISRCAGGRRKYKETPQWARGLLTRLVDERLIEVNERGHYRSKPEPSEVQPVAEPENENYFPAPESPLIVGDNYFSPPEPVAQKSEPPAAKPERWISPHIEAILKKAGKKVGKAGYSS